MREQPGVTAPGLRIFSSAPAAAAGFIVVLIAAAVLLQAGTIPPVPAPAAANASTVPIPSTAPETPDAAPVTTKPVSSPVDGNTTGTWSGPGLSPDKTPAIPAPSRTQLYSGPAVTVTGTAPYSFTAPVMGSNPDVPVIDATSLAARVHALINRERQAHGMAILQTNPSLTSLALAHSRDMASHGYFGHLNLQERDATARGAAAGYACHREHDPYYTYTIAENLYATYRYDSVLFIHGSATGFGWKTEEMIAEETVDGWMKSPDHRDNLLDPDLRQEGIGVAVADADLVFITEDLC